MSVAHAMTRPHERPIAVACLAGLVDRQGQRTISATATSSIRSVTFLLRLKEYDVVALTGEKSRGPVIGSNGGGLSYVAGPMGPFTGRGRLRWTKRSSAKRPMAYDSFWSCGAFPEKVQRRRLSEIPVKADPALILLSAVIPGHSAGPPPCQLMKSHSSTWNRSRPTNRRISKTSSR